MAPFESSDEGEISETGIGGSKASLLPMKPEGGSSVDRRDRVRDRPTKSPDDDLNNNRQRRDGPPIPHPAARGQKRPRQPSVRETGGRDQQQQQYGGRDYGRERDRPRERDREYRPSGTARDPRRFKVRYEDSLQYDDIDSRGSRSGPDRSSHSRRDTPDHDDWSRDRDRRRDPRSARDRSRDRRPENKKARNRSRSPGPPAPSGPSGFRREDRARHGIGYDNGGRSNRADNPKYGDHGDRFPRDQPWSSRPGDNAKHYEKPEAKFTTKGTSARDNTDATAREQAAQDAYVSRHSSAAGTNPTDDGDRMQVDEPEPEPEPIDVDAEIERRRRRRDELLAKSKAEEPSPLPSVVTTLQASETAQSSPLTTRGNTPLPTNGNGVTPSISAVASPRESTPGAQDGTTPPMFDMLSDQQLINTHAQGTGDDEDGPSAADYDPTADMKADGLRDEARHGRIGLHGEWQPEDGGAAPASDETKENATTSADKEEGSEDGDFDMFAEEFDEDKYTGPKLTDGGAEDGQARGAAANGGGILDGDDKDGYYKLRVGEVINGRYQIESTLGKGMFSGVVRAKDATTGQHVAIKMMRNNDALRKGGFTEIAILQKINKADPENRRHVVKFERHFEHKSHLCMVFENLSLNLREVLRKFGNNVGLNLFAVRVYARQIFISLAHLKACSIIHADLKPDNILVSENRNILKICDLGTAIDRSDAATAHNDVSPYLVSRFYRAPEIIMGMPYDYSVDMWSIGCTLYELYTGKILFTGESNNQMLKTIMEIRGKFSSKLYRRGQLSHHHFDDKGNFVSVERDKLSIGKNIVKILPVVKPTRDLRTRLMAASSGMGEEEGRSLNLFVDLLERCLALNPDRRVSPAEALRHGFFGGKK